MGYPESDFRTLRYVLLGGVHEHRPPGDGSMARFVLLIIAAHFSFMVVLAMESA